MPIPGKTKVADVYCPICERLYKSYCDRLWWLQESKGGRKYPELTCLDCLGLLYRTKTGKPGADLGHNDERGAV